MQQREDPFVGVYIVRVSDEVFFRVALGEYDGASRNMKDGESVRVDGTSLAAERDDAERDARKRRGGHQLAELFLHHGLRSRPPAQRAFGEHVVEPPAGLAKDGLPCHALLYRRVYTAPAADISKRQNAPRIALALQKSRYDRWLEVEDSRRRAVQVRHLTLPGRQAAPVRGAPRPCLGPCGMGKA